MRARAREEKRDRSASGRLLFVRSGSAQVCRRDSPEERRGSDSASLLFVAPTVKECNTWLSWPTRTVGDGSPRMAAERRFASSGSRDQSD